jgi:hypothetical protein
MDVRDAMIQRLFDRMMRMRGALERFDDASAERVRVGPRWNVRDLAGHFVFWDDEAVRQMLEMLRGRPRPTYDFDKVNDAVYHRYRRMSFVMLLPQLRAAEERLVHAVRGVDSALLVDSPVRDWIDAAGADHYDDHWPSLKKAVDAI